MCFYKYGTVLANPVSSKSVPTAISVWSGGPPTGQAALRGLALCGRASNLPILLGASGW